MVAAGCYEALLDIPERNLKSRGADSLDVTNLGDGTSPDRVLLEFFKHFFKWSLEHGFDDVSCVFDGVGLSVGM